MTTEHKITAALAVALAVCLAFIGIGYFREREANARLAGQRESIDATVKTLEDANKDISAKASAVIAKLDAQKKTVVTPAQIVQAAPQVIQLPAPVQAVTKDIPDGPDGTTIKQGSLIIAPESAKPWFDAQVACKEDSVKLDACTKQRDNDESVIAAKDHLIADQQIALKGGTKWHRIVTALKWVGVGAAGGAIAVAAAHH